MPFLSFLCPTSALPTSGHWRRAAHHKTSSVLRKSPTPAQRALDVEKRRARSLKKKRSRQSHPLPNPFGLPPPFMPHAGFAGGHWRRKAYTKQAPFYTNPPHPHSGRGGFGGMAACPIESEAETASPFRHSSSADRWDFTGMGTEKGWPAPWRAKRGGTPHDSFTAG